MSVPHWAFDFERARHETPGADGVIHFNNAGASLVPECVLETVIEHLRLEARMGGYEAANARAAELEAVYSSAAKLINARPDEIALVEHATRAWDSAFYAVPLGPGDRILTSVVEYAANFVAFLQVSKRTGALVDVVSSDDTGAIDVSALRDSIDDRVKLIALTHVPTNGGLVNPAAEVGRVAREAGILYLLDACQSVGQMPIDVETIGCDMLSATGRKFLRGPRGTGFLYVRRSALDRLEPLMIDHHAAEWTSPGEYRLRPDARRFETWESNVACRLGLGVAIDYAMSWGIADIRDRVYGLADRLRAPLSEIPGVAVRDLGAERCGIVTFTKDGEDAAAVRDRLAAHGINVTVSDVLSTRLDMEARRLENIVRASVHYYNTDDEIDRFCQVLEEES